MNTNDGDSTLVGAAQGGDKAAFAALLTRHRPMLLAVCYRLLNDRALTEDAAQEAALQALRSLYSLEQPERFGSWLCGIGANICRRWLRERASHASPSWEALQNEWHLVEPRDRAPGPDEAAAEADMADHVRRAVGELPQGQQAAVHLFYLDGLTHAETAEALGIEVSAVKTRLYKARQGLRGRLLAVWGMVDGYAGTALRAVEDLITPAPNAPVPVTVPVKTPRRLSPHNTSHHS